jgi:hypothetical protein
MLFLLDTTIIFSILEFILIILNGYTEINYLCIIFIVYSIVVILFLIYNIKTLPLVIPIILLSLSFLFTFYSIFHCYTFNLLHLLLLSGVYTVYLLRCNIGIIPAKLNIYEIIHNIIKNPLIIVILFIMYFTFFVIRYLVLKDLSFSISCEYFLFYYLIIFCLWLPTKVFVDLILIFILKVDIKFNTEDFTMDKLTIILISCILSLTFKSIVSLFIYIGARKTNYFFNIFKSLKSYRLPNFTTSIISNKQILPPRLCVIPLILGVELPYSNTQNEDIIFKNTEKYVSIRELRNKGFREYPLYNLILPNSFKIDQYSSLAKQLIGMKNDIFVKVSKGGALPLSQVRGRVTQSLNIQQNNIYIFDRFNPVPMWTIMDDSNFKDEMSLSNKNSNKEAYTYGFMNCLLNKYFPYDKGFIVVPQGTQTEGQPGFIIKRNGEVWAVVESKALRGEYSWTDLYTQAIEYANRNHHSDVCHVITNKGTFIFFGIFSQDFHSMNGCNKKLTFTDGYIGLEADTNFNVQPLPQRNTFQPQHRLYQLYNSDMHQKRSVCSILQHMADNDIHLSTLNWGGKFETAEDGGIIKKKKH